MRRHPWRVDQFIAQPAAKSRPSTCDGEGAPTRSHWEPPTAMLGADGRQLVATGCWLGATSSRCHLHLAEKHWGHPGQAGWESRTCRESIEMGLPRPGGLQDYPSSPALGSAGTLNLRDKHADSGS
jgi:hypothetical protein